MSSTAKSNCAIFFTPLHCCSDEGAEAFIPDAITGISSQHANYVLIPLLVPFAHTDHTFKTTLMARPSRWRLFPGFRVVSQGCVTGGAETG
jgi:hypothetical protein